MGRPSFATRKDGEGGEEGQGKALISIREYQAAGCKVAFCEPLVAFFHLSADFIGG